MKKWHFKMQDRDTFYIRAIFLLLLCMSIYYIMDAAGGSAKNRHRAWTTCVRSAPFFPHRSARGPACTHVVSSKKLYGYCKSSPRKNSSHISQSECLSRSVKPTPIVADTCIMRPCSCGGRLLAEQVFLLPPFINFSVMRLYPESVPLRSYPPFMINTCTMYYGREALIRRTPGLYVPFRPSFYRSNWYGMIAGPGRSSGTIGRWGGRLISWRSSGAWRTHRMG
jgi:hypothetical protein